MTYVKSRTGQPPKAGLSIEPAVPLGQATVAANRREPCRPKHKGRAEHGLTQRRDHEKSQQKNKYDKPGADLVANNARHPR